MAPPVCRFFTDITYMCDKNYMSKLLCAAHTLSAKKYWSKLRFCTYFSKNVLLMMGKFVVQSSRKVTGPAVLLYFQQMYKAGFIGRNPGEDRGEVSPPLPGAGPIDSHFVTL